MNVIKSMDDDMILEHASENKFGTSEFKYKKDIKIDSLPLAQSQITLFINQSVKEVFHMTEQKILFKYDGETELAIGKDVVLQKGILETPEDCKMPVRKIEEEKREEKKPANYKTFIKIFFNLNS